MKTLFKLDNLNEKALPLKWHFTIAIGTALAAFGVSWVLVNLF